MRIFITTIHRSRGIVVAGVLWVAMVAAGFVQMHRHDAEPSPAGRAPHLWPGTLPFRPGVRHVVMAVHPRCPCTRLSVEALRSMQDEATSPVVVELLIYRPRESSEDWSGKAPRMDGVTRTDDPGGERARALGLRTSGEVAAYEGSGRLIFSGGILPGRTRQGECPGSRAMEAIFRGRAPSTSRSPVFGCSLDVAVVATDDWGGRS